MTETASIYFDVEQTDRGTWTATADDGHRTYLMIEDAKAWLPEECIRYTARLTEDEPLDTAADFISKAASRFRTITKDWQMSDQDLRSCFRFFLFKTFVQPHFYGGDRDLILETAQERFLKEEDVLKTARRMYPILDE